MNSPLNFVFLFFLMIQYCYIQSVIYLQSMSCIISVFLRNYAVEDMSLNKVVKNSFQDYAKNHHEDYFSLVESHH